MHIIEALSLADALEKLNHRDPTATALITLAAAYRDQTIGRLAREQRALAEADVEVAAFEIERSLWRQRDDRPKG